MKKPGKVQPWSLYKGTMLKLGSGLGLGRENQKSFYLARCRRSGAAGLFLSKPWEAAGVAAEGEDPMGEGKRHLH